MVICFVIDTIVTTIVSMLHIPYHPLFQKNKTYTQLAQKYLPEDSTTSKFLQKEQEIILEQLTLRINREFFYTITDVKTGEITESQGVQKWLGYTDSHLTSIKYLNLLHPSQIVLQHIYASALFELFIENKIIAIPFKPLITATIALKSKSGKYFYCKRQSYPFELTTDNRVIAYLNEFTIIKEYENELFNIRLNNINDELTLINELLRHKIAKIFEDSRCLSIQEIRILKRYAKNEKITSEIISQSFKIEKTTVDTYNKRILLKMESHFTKRFDNAKLVAAYLKSVKLI
jgi:hypothetical protein